MNVVEIRVVRLPEMTQMARAARRESASWVSWEAMSGFTRCLGGISDALSFFDFYMGQHCSTIPPYSQWTRRIDQMRWIKKTGSSAGFHKRAVKRGFTLRPENGRCSTEHKRGENSSYSLELSFTSSLDLETHNIHPSLYSTLLNVSIIARLSSLRPLHITHILTQWLHA